MVALTNSERQKKHYDANKEALLEKKRQRYHANKAKKLTPVKPVEPVVVEQELPSKSLLVEIPDELPTDELPNDSKLINLPIEELPVINIIENMINSLPDETDGNKLFRIKNFVSLVKIFNPTSYKKFLKQLRKPVNSIKQIKSFEYKPNQKYATNTLIALYKAILYFFNKFNLKLKLKEKYEDQIQMADAIALLELKKNNVASIPTFQQYLQAVLNEYGLHSREYLITKLYQEAKCRDDFQLIIVNDKSILDELANYLVLGKTTNIVLNNYKTFDKYGKIDVVLSDNLTHLLYKFIENNQLQLGDNLFNTSHISMIVSRMNNKLGFKGHGAINLFRKMLASDASNLPLEDQLKLAKDMCHSFKVTNSNYVIKNY